jgi:hypothetical protein
VLPSIVQLSAAGGKILWTRYVPPGGVLPDLEPFSARADRLEEEMLPPALRLYHEAGRERLASTRRGRLVVGGISLLTGSAALYIVNANTTIEYFDPETASTRLPQLKQTANLTATGSSLLLLGGTGLLVVSFLME